MRRLPFPVIPTRQLVWSHLTLLTSQHLESNFAYFGPNEAIRAKATVL